jgi:Sec-independent protein translocase protein TatA
MLAYAAKQRAQLERSFRTAIADMKQSQKERQARQVQPAQTAQPTKPSSASASKPAGPQAPPPDYVMSEGAEAHPVFCAPVTPDTR